MIELATLLLIADSAVSPEAVFAVIIILALIVIVVSTWLFRSRLRYRREVLAQRPLAKRCPNCNAVMEPGASFCPHCGTRVPQVTTVTP